MSFSVGDRVVYIGNDPDLDNFEYGARGEVNYVIRDTFLPYGVQWDEKFDKNGYFSDGFTFAEQELMLECAFDDQSNDEPLPELDIKELFV